MGESARVNGFRPAKECSYHEQNFADGLTQAGSRSISSS